MKTPASPSNNWHYNKDLKLRARELRKHSTKAEICLWSFVLKGGWLMGYEFLRQRPVLNYIADFFCKDLMLIIELDGLIHEFDEIQVRDTQKQQALEAVGFTVLRFSNWEVLHRFDEVAEDLRVWIVEFEKRNGIVREAEKKV